MIQQARHGWNLPKKLDEPLMVDDEENQLSGLDWSTARGDVLGEVAGTPWSGGPFAEFFITSPE